MAPDDEQSVDAEADIPEEALDAVSGGVTVGAINITFNRPNAAGNGVQSAE